MIRQLVLSSPWVLAGRYFLLSIRGTRGLVARLDATFRAIRGIGEGGFWKRSGNEVAETKWRKRRGRKETQSNNVTNQKQFVHKVYSQFGVRFRLVSSSFPQQMA